MDQEQQWAKALQSAKHQSRQLGATPLAIQKKQNQEELTYYKGQLLRQVRAGDRAGVSETWKRLLKLRARQTVIALANLRSLYGQIEPTALQKEVEKYYRDCASLGASLRGDFGV